MRINSANTQKTTLLITLIACILTYTLVKTTNRVKAADTTVALIQELADGLLQADITVDQLASSAGSISPNEEASDMKLHLETNRSLKYLLAWQT